MHSFQVIDGKDDGLIFPDWISPSLMNYTAKIRGEIQRINNDLSWDQIGMLAAFGKKELDLAAHHLANLYANHVASDEGIDPEDKIYFQKCSTPKGVCLMEGEGLILHARLTEDDDEIDPPDWKSVEKILPEKDAVCVLYAHALHLVDNALSSQIAGDMDGALGCLAMAGDVMIMASEATAKENGIHWERWHSTEPRRKGAQKLHVETYKLQREVIEYWTANINNSLSAAKAATLLSKIFPLSHRTLSKYVMMEKKSLRASTV